VGCGNKNEEFYGCSDIAIRNESESIIDPIITTTEATNIQRKCISAITFSRSFDLTALMSQYCQQVCSNNCLFDKGHSNSTSYDDCIKSCEKLCICE